MKFEYDTSSEDKEVVAFINSNGSLTIRDEQNYGRIFVLHGTGIMTGYNLPFRPEHDTVVKEFYRGDTIKITF